MMKTTRHSLMAKGIMVLLSLVVLVYAFTYAWYISPDTPVNATGISGSVESTGDFEYAIGFYNNGTGGNYKTTDFTKESTALNLESLKVYDGTSSDNDGNDSGRYYHNYNLLHDYKPIDITGDGKTLIRPAMSYGNSAINTASNDYSIAEPNVQYISFDLYFRSKVPGISIKLGDGSWAKGACEINSGNMTGSSATNKSTYGDFSRDAIVGAVRIAFVPYDYSSERDNIPSTLDVFQANTPDFLDKRASFIWLPRTELHLNDNGGTTGWTLTTNSTSNDDKQHKYYNIFDTSAPRSTSTVYDNTITPADLSESSQEFCRVSNEVQFDDYYYTKVNVRIWIEGTDAESRRATSGGKFEVNFKFTTT